MIMNDPSCFEYKMTIISPKQAYVKNDRAYYSYREHNV